MKILRRQFLQFAAAAAAAVPHFASALDYPSRPVHIVVRFSAGGTQDPIARLMGQWLSERLGQPFIIENRPGAGGNIAAEAVARATPDGYTLLLIGPPNVINAALYDKLNFSFIRDIVPIANIVNQPLVMVVNPSIPPRTVPEFIAYAKANPSKINMASSGNGTSPHLAGEMFKKMTDINMVHVPYRGVAPAVTDLLGRHAASHAPWRIELVGGFLAGDLTPLRIGIDCGVAALGGFGRLQDRLTPGLPLLGRRPNF